MSQGTCKSQTPICLFLSKLPQKEVQSLKAALAESWSSVDIESPSSEGFHYIPWSGILGPNATLRQIYHLGMQINVQSGRSTCLLLDAMSGFSKIAFLAQYNDSDEYGPSLRVGEVKDLCNAAQYVIDHENGREDSKKVYLEITIRDPEIPIDSQEQQNYGTTEKPTPSCSDFPHGAGITELVLPIIWIVKSDSKETGVIHGKLSKIAKAPKASFLPVQWIGDDKATRAMMYSVARRGLKGDSDSERNYRYLVYLDERTKKDGSVLLSRFVNLDDTGGNDPLRRRLEIARVPVNVFGRIWEAYVKYIESGNLMFPDSFMAEGEYEETIRNPDLPLSVRKPLYLQQGRWPDTPTFFLASLSEADGAKVKNDLETACDYDAGSHVEKRFHYIPWIGSEDVLQAQLAIWIPRYMSYLVESSNGRVGEALFIDKASPGDMHVILAECVRELIEPEEYRKDEDKVMKIRWGRVPAQQAQSNCINLNMANVSWDELFFSINTDEGVAKSQKERKELAELGKPFAEAGVWDE